MTADVLDPAEVCEKNQGLMMLIVKRYGRRLPRPRDLEGLRSECWAALWRAAKKFDPGQGFTFSTYAGVSMKNAARRFIRSELSRGIGGLSRPDPRHPRIVVLGERAFCPRFMGSTSPIHRATARDDSDRVVWTDEEWAEVLSPLGDRERAAVSMYFRGGMKLRDIGKVFGETAERVKSIIKGGLSVLRDAKPELIENL